MYMWKWETSEAPRGVVVVIHDMLEHHDYYTSLIFRFRRLGYHVVTGDLPGHGQTTRLNKGHINSFSQYIERITEWYEIARKYELPVFVFAQGLGGLIVIEAVRLKKLHPDGLILINPMLRLKQSFIHRKNTIRTSIKSSSDETRFDPGIKLEYFTTDPSALEKYKNDELMIDKVSYQWYRTVSNQMKKTSDNIENVPAVPVISLFSIDNEIIEPFISATYIKMLRSPHTEVHMLNERDHGLLQKEDNESEMYLIDQFFKTRLFTIGIRP